MTLPTIKLQSNGKSTRFTLETLVKSSVDGVIKQGQLKVYDARKIVYSGLRVLLMLEGGQNVRSYLESLLEDPQFKS